LSTLAREGRLTAAPSLPFVFDSQLRPPPPAPSAAATGEEEKALVARVWGAPDPPSRELPGRVSYLGS
jgi:hypothetical protein